MLYERCEHAIIGMKVLICCAHAHCWIFLTKRFVPSFASPETVLSKNLLNL
jgi:hypothetical protein